MKELSDTILIEIGELRFSDLSPQEAQVAGEQFRMSFEAAFEKGMQGQNLDEIGDVSLPDLEILLADLSNPGKLGETVAAMVVREMLK